jgi:uncharacterized protein (AIM24 family)
MKTTSTHKMCHPRSFLNNICSLFVLFVLFTNSCFATVIANEGKPKVKAKRTVLAKSLKNVCVLTKARGRVEIKNDKLGWQKCYSGSFLSDGDELRTGKQSVAVLVFVSGVQVQMNESTSFKIDTSRVELSEHKIYIGEGNVYLSSSKVKINMYVRTPTAVVAVRGTKFTTSVGKLVSGPLATVVAVIEGLVEVSNDYGRVSVKTNEIVTVEQNQVPEMPRLATPDEIEKYIVWKEAEEKATLGKIRLNISQGTANTNEPVKIKLDCLNDKGVLLETYNGLVTITAESDTAAFSNDDGKTWLASSIQIKNGVAEFYVKESVARMLMISVFNDDLHGSSANLEIVAPAIEQELPKKTIELKLKSGDDEFELELDLEK